MTTTLTTEKIVTDLLSAHEILKPQPKNFYFSSYKNLNDYIQNPPEKIENQVTKNNKSKYTFIKI